MTLWIISATMLFVVSALCFVCIFDDGIPDNLAERVGMTILIFGLLGRAKDVIERQDVNAVSLTIHVGLFVYSVGAACRVSLLRMRRQGGPHIRRFDRWIERRNCQGADADDVHRRRTND